MSAIYRDDERDECGLAKDRAEAQDAKNANEYRRGRRDGLLGLSTAGRPDDAEQDRHYLRGHLEGTGERMRRAA